MGLDFYIEKRPKGKSFSNKNWEEITYGRNCHKVKDITLNYLDKDTREKGIYCVSFGTLNKILKGLIDELISRKNFNKKDELINDDYIKTLFFISELSKELAISMCDYEYEGIEYDYRIIDSY